MKIAHDILATAAGLGDDALLARVETLAGREREALAELIGHLGELETRRSVYAAAGYGSLFGYCTGALRLSEDAAYNRIEAARACRRFPAILDLLASGAVTLTAIRMLGRHLTPENHEWVLAAASGRSKAEIEELVARLSPRPDVPSSIRQVSAPSVVSVPVLQTPAATPLPVIAAPEREAAPPAEPAPAPPLRHGTVRPTAPERYHVQFTIGGETREKLRRLQDLLAREVPGGDPGVIFDRAITLLLDRVERTKLAATTKRRASRSGTATPPPGPVTRSIPRSVRRAVWRRDGGQCAFVAGNGRRCRERKYLELHHIHPHAYDGPATVQNIALRCRLHNVYEGELAFGPLQARFSPRLRTSQGAT